MIYLNKLQNLLPTTKIVRETVPAKLSEGSIFVYPYEGIDRLVFIINDTYNVYDKFFATNKVVDVYTPRQCNINKPNLRTQEMVKVDDKEVFIKEHCPSIKRCSHLPVAIGDKNFFFNMDPYMSAIKRKLKLNNATCINDALSLIMDAVNSFSDSHPRKYIMISLDVDIREKIPETVNEINRNEYKNGFNFLSFLLHAFMFEEQFIRDNFKGCTLIFMSKRGLFKMDMSNLPPIESKEEKKLINQLMFCIRKIINVQVGTLDNIANQKVALNEEDAKEAAAEKGKEAFKGLKKEMDTKVDDSIDIDTLDTSKPEDKAMHSAILNKDKDMNRHMTKLIHTVDDDKSAVMVEQYVKTVVDNPDDVKAAIGAGIIKDIKQEMVKKDQVTYTPKEKILQKKLQAVTIRDKSKEQVIKDLKMMKLEPETFDIEGVNPEMGTNSFVNFNKSYSKYVKDAHIKKIAKHFAKNEVPLYIKKIDIEDISDEFNYLDRYKFQFEDANGKQSTLAVKVPKYIDGKFLYINGTRFVLYNQLIPFPIVKVGEDVIVTGAKNKATLTYKGSKYVSISQAKLSKGLEGIDKDKYKGMLSFGDYYEQNTASGKTTIEYAYISKQITAINTKNIDFIFRIDDAIKKYGDMSADGYVPLGTYKDKLIKVSLENDKCYGFEDNTDGLELTEMLVQIAGQENDELGKLFRGMFDEQIDPNISDLVAGVSKEELPELYDKINSARGQSTALVQTHVKIMGRWIPLIYVLMYTNGLFSVLDRAKIDYRLVYNIDPKHPDKIRSKPRIVKSRQFMVETFDAYIIFNMNSAEDVSLTFPLTKMDFRSYKTSQLENRDHVATIIEDYGGSINLPIYLDRFKENFIDPIMADVLEDHNISPDFMSVMLYANGLLGSGKTSKSTDITQQRIRGEESIVSGMYDVIATAYEEYAVKKKRGNQKGAFTMNENDLLNLIQELPSFKPYSSLNPIGELTETYTVMSKGHRGKNMERAYTLEQRMFDDSFYGVIGLSSPAAGTVGVNKQLVLDPAIISPKGYLDIKGSAGVKDMKTKNLLTVTEAATPFSLNHDDPQRSDMNMSQLTQIIGVEDADPYFVSYGFDNMLVHMTNDFAVSAKDDGTVIAIDDYTIVLQYKDKTKEVRKLKNLEKNSAKNFYTNNDMMIKKGIHVGSKFKKNDILAYNTKFFKDFYGVIKFTPGPMVWAAVVSEDVTYEDSIKISKSLSDRCGKTIIKHYPIRMDRMTKLSKYAMLGDNVFAGDKLMVFNKTSDDEFYNTLLEDVDSELLNIEKKVKRAGKITSINIYYTCKFDELSKSLKDFISQVDRLTAMREKNIRMHGSDFDRKVKLTTSKQVAPGAKINGLRVEEGSILVEYYVGSKELLAIGDKTTINSALKGIIGDIKDDEEMPKALTSNRRVDICIRAMSIGNRKTYSIYYNMGINKAFLKVGDMLKKIFEKY